MLKLGMKILQFIYNILKLLPTKDKVLFISRQDDNISLDFKLVVEQLNHQNIKTVVLTRRLKKDDSVLAKIRYCFHMFRQMYELATSKVVVLDTYCILVSILKHKKDLKVIQMWHALGSLKKFGYSVEGKEEGTTKEVNSMMKMHKNYDLLLTSSKECRKNFMEAFNYDASSFAIIPLPRVDLLNDKKYLASKRKEIISKYGMLKKKKNILYAPTFRKNENADAIKKLIDAVDYEKFNLIIKLHPISSLEVDDDRVIKDNDYTTLEMLSVADYIITDYSAIIFEIAVLNKPLYLYTYDFDSYTDKRDFYIDYKNEIPGIMSDDPKFIMKEIEKNNFDMKKMKQFSRKYVEYDGNSTLKIVDIIKNYLGIN